MKERLYSFDNLKALLIYSVVLGHMVRPMGGFGAIGVFLYVFIYIFHMPAFLYVLGRFVKPSLRKIGFFAVSYLILQLLYFLFYKYVLFVDIEFNILVPIYASWYLLTVVFYIGLSYLFPKEISHKKKILILGVSVLVSLGIGFCPFIGETLSLSRTIVFFPFFLAGRYGIFENLNEKNIGRRAVLYGILSVLLSFIYIFISSCNFIALHNKLCYAAGGSNVFERLIAMGAAFCIIKFLLCVIPNKNIPVVSNIGQHTLFIYILHGFIIQFISNKSGPYNSIWVLFGGSLIILFVLYGCSVLIENIKKKFDKERQVIFK